MNNENKSQKKFGNKTNFEFEDDALKYTIKDSSGRQTFSIAYGNIPTDKGEVEERNPWYRNVGFFWVLIGIFSISANYAETGNFRGSMWFTLGVVCFAIYWVLRTKYTTMDTDKGRIFVIQNSDHDDIINAIDSRRKQQWIEWYGSINFENDPSTEIGKFQWLLKNEAISEQDFLQIKKQILQHHELEETPQPDKDRTLN